MALSVAASPLSSLPVSVSAVGSQPWQRMHQTTRLELMVLLVPVPVLALVPLALLHPSLHCSHCKLEM
jgi:hypothetical protein